jgi:hypothetical protein
MHIHGILLYTSALCAYILHQVHRELAAYGEGTKNKTVWKCPLKLVVTEYPYVGP